MIKENKDANQWEYWFEHEHANEAILLAALPFGMKDYKDSWELVMARLDKAYCEKFEIDKDEQTHSEQPM